MRSGIIVLLAAVLLATACGGSDAASKAAGEAATRHLQNMTSGNWGPDWDDLYPGQQSAVPRDLYVQCMSKVSLPAAESIAVVDVTGAAIKQASVTESSGKQVQLEERHGKAVNKVTVKEVQVDKAWHWLLSENAVQAYQAGNCPGSR